MRQRTLGSTTTMNAPGAQNIAQRHPTSLMFDRAFGDVRNQEREGSGHQRQEVLNDRTREEAGDGRGSVWEGWKSPIGHHHQSGASQMRKPSGLTGITRPIMITGCIPCLALGIPCDPRNAGCKLAMSTEWTANKNGESSETLSCTEEQRPPPGANGLALLRPDTRWRHNWRERHSLTFFATYSASQMSGFFHIEFWSRCIQYSYHEPVILHALSAIGALHESILQGAFIDEEQKVQAVEFALTQCNRSIGYLTGSSRTANEKSDSRRRNRLPVSKLALIACVLFTCFEAMQGHSDSAVKHALQGKALIESQHKSMPRRQASQDEDVDLMRSLVERLEVQATALIGRNARPTGDETNDVPPLPETDRIYNLDHAHVTLHTAMNNNMQYLQRLHPGAPADHYAITQAKKTLRYAPWYSRWETLFSEWLAEHHETLSNIDRKRAMVLKANQIVGTMLAVADQRAGDAAYDRFDKEFRAIVELSREVLADFSCPPVATLDPGSAGVGYFSCSLWVTDPLWMAISRCRNPEIRQAAFALLRQNPRQEGIWHTGPQRLSPQPQTESGETSATSQESKGSSPSRVESSRSSPSSEKADVPLGEVPKDVKQAEEGGNMRARSEWLNLVANAQTQDANAAKSAG